MLLYRPASDLPGSPNSRSSPTSNCKRWSLRRNRRQRLCHGNDDERALRAKTRQASCRCDRTLPVRGSFGSEFPQRGSGDEVALKVEGVVNGGVHAEEALGGSSRLEALLLALSSSHGLMRILCPIILCALTRCTVLPGERPGRQTLAPAGSTRGGSGGDEWSEAL